MCDTEAIVFCGANNRSGAVKYSAFRRPSLPKNSTKLSARDHEHQVSAQSSRKMMRVLRFTVSMTIPPLTSPYNVSNNDSKASARSEGSLQWGAANLVRDESQQP